jgi:hypothetical protein
VCLNANEIIRPSLTTAREAEAMLLFLFLFRLKAQIQPVTTAKDERQMGCVCVFRLSLFSLLRDASPAALLVVLAVVKVIIVILIGHGSNGGLALLFPLAYHVVVAPLSFLNLFLDNWLRSCWLVWRLGLLGLL